MWNDFEFLPPSILAFENSNGYLVTLIQSPMGDLIKGLFDTVPARPICIVYIGVAVEKLMFVETGRIVAAINFDPVTYLVHCVYVAIVNDAETARC